MISWTISDFYRAFEGKFLTPGSEVTKTKMLENIDLRPRTPCFASCLTQALFEAAGKQHISIFWMISLVFTKPLVPTQASLFTALHAKCCITQFMMEVLVLVVQKLTTDGVVDFTVKKTKNNYWGLTCRS